jgi:hypothetical protein
MQSEGNKRPRETFWQQYYFFAASSSLSFKKRLNCFQQKAPTDENEMGQKRNFEKTKFELPCACHAYRSPRNIMTIRGIAFYGSLPFISSY